ncbi:sulfatase-like hydrolase/transferase [Flavobacterium sp. CYK-4]|uniref:LTA synthase family protein n=1 Tax=Flavobacterium lotistagni TaxID=2709660 RepID=UPI00140C5147|nr:alkaline phosphatase family protein [Flavobacterium lotistagni]NHM08064.1 sulfatase-like hydrolase/transferase [Flavobacterium lotistagni]
MADSKWNKTLKELANLFFFWCFGIVFFFLFRVIFILSFHKQLTFPVSAGEFFKTFLMGFRFDCTAVSYFMVPAFLLLLSLWYFEKFGLIRAVRKVCQYLFVIFSTLICVVTINYFAEYHSQFNNFLFLGLYDDQKAVMKTVMEDFHPWWNLLALVVVIISGILVLRYFESKDFIYRKLSKLQFKGHRTVMIVASLLLFVMSIRGSVTDVPALRKWAAVSTDPFLNKTIINPYRSLAYALEDFKEINILEGKNPYMSEAEFFNIFSKPQVSDYLKKTAPGTNNEKPKQIFLVIMESYDSWPLMDQYAPMGLSPQLSAIKNQGTHFSYFLPAAYATFDSFGAIVTNVPYTGVNISKIGELNEPFMTSMFMQFKKLGYQTNMFYGGFASWQNIAEFTKYQGADRFFSATDLGGDNNSGTWGVEDEKLFELVQAKTNPEQYSFNVILTSSYHAPYTVEVYKKGFPYKSEKDFPAAMQKYYDGSMTMEELGHLWYGDYAIGKFMEKATQKYPDAVYGFTGDHYGRRFLNSKPNLYETSSVGFILYGKNIPISANKTPGSHIDIMPTLIEMVAPKGFEYYSFGTSMYDAQKVKSMSYSKIVTASDLYYIPKDAPVEKIELATMKASQQPATPLLNDYNKQMSLAWYYTMKGNTIKKK